MAWSGIDTWANKVNEGLPAGGLHLTFQGFIKVAGLVLARIESGSLRFSNNLGEFYEAGRKSPTLFSGAMGIDGRIRTALIDLGMMRLVGGYQIGDTLEPSIFDYTDEQAKAIIQAKDSDTISTFPLDDNLKGAGKYAYLSTNFYPHPVNIEFEINKDQLESLIGSPSGLVPSLTFYRHLFKVEGALLGSGGIMIRAGSNIVMSDYSFVGTRLKIQLFNTA